MVSNFHPNQSEATSLESEGPMIVSEMASPLSMPISISLVIPSIGDRDDLDPSSRFVSTLIQKDACTRQNTRYLFYLFNAFKMTDTHCNTRILHDQFTFKGKAGTTDNISSIIDNF